MRPHAQSAGLRVALARLRLDLATAFLESRAALRARLGRSRPDLGHRQRTGRPSRADLPRVLVVCPYSIHPARSGGAVRHWNLLRELADRFEIHLAIFGTTRDNPGERQALATFSRSLHYLRREDAPPQQPWSLTPRSAEFFDFERARRQLRDLAATLDVDVVQLEHTESGQFANLFAGRAVALTELDLTFESLRRRRALGFERSYATDRILWRTELDRKRQLRYEVAACDRVDRVHVMSESDAELLAHYLRDRARRIEVIPNGVDCAAFAPAPDPAPPRFDVVFVGSFGHTPNLDAVDWLLSDLWPAVRAARPDARLGLVGAHPPLSVRRWNGREGIEVLGSVDDIVGAYRAASVLIAPIRAGSGTRLKLLEAFASATPVVATPLAAEGLDVRAGEHLQLGATAPELVAATLSLLVDPEKRRRLGAASRQLAVERYDWSHSADLLAASWSALAARRKLPRRPMAAARAASRPAPEVSVVLPTRNGGARLLQVLERILSQATDFRFEVICVDSGSSPAQLERMRALPVRIEQIPAAAFNHGLTRDHGARIAAGRVVAFLNQDALPTDGLWLHFLATSLLRAGRYAAVQGGIQEDPETGVFYWQTGGPRFYFTQESSRWIARHRGIGFSTVNAALRREVWERHPFGWAPILEDKKWQAEALDAGLSILDQPRACVFHSHDYDLPGLWRRCRSEGFGWQQLGEVYPARAVVEDLRHRETWRLWRTGLRERRLRSLAELLFPIVRPLALYVGNRWSRSSAV